ncbi:MAG: bifunctional diaminohydroxyphosphoribosylaminopyrimidine deaminase/5-amino-6-(5-phosphoribosylamino)uracil reductase RibD [Candidatus Delongbacteria bacterium]|nr:bifunctional diaminohydroxyphosphoribosylaminopyrimidine deaminase/5-amino-6-(5-phosphoribosylamino)uracil reductase RibD [Candidatus Delongbacteria bacterium]
MSFSVLERQAMQLALQLAEQGRGQVSPNPLVGAVLLRDGAITGQAFHERLGGLHAEAQLLQSLPASVTEGATLVVNLEPCNHQGRTPPCARLVAERGIKRVVIATRDPNQQVKGGGAEFLRHQGVVVECGLLAVEAARLNRGFLARHLLEHPWVTLKIARTLDNCITPAGSTTGAITGVAAHRDSHRLRAEHDAILVGINTIINDNPQLNVRHLPPANPAGSDAAGPLSTPVKVVLDQRLRLPLTSHVVKRVPAEPLWVLTSEDAIETEAADKLRKAGVVLIPIASVDGLLDPAQVLGVLLERGINSVLIEGGAGVYHTFSAAACFDELVIYTAGWIAGDGLQLRPAPTRLELELDDVIQIENDTRARYSIPTVSRRWLQFIETGREDRCLPD